MVKNKRYLVTDYLKINAPIRGEINEKILGRRFEIGEKNNKKKNGGSVAKEVHVSERACYRTRKIR
jgi:hypothetical protein